MAELSALIAGDLSSDLARQPVRSRPAGGGANTQLQPIVIAVGAGQSSVPQLGRTTPPQFVSSGRGEKLLISDIYRKAQQVGQAGEEAAKSVVPVLTGALRNSLEWFGGRGIYTYNSMLEYHSIQNARAGYMAAALAAMTSAISGNVVFRIDGWVSMLFAGQPIVIPFQETVTFPFSRFISASGGGDTVVMRVAI